MSQALTLNSPKAISDTLFNPALQGEGSAKKRTAKVLDSGSEPTIGAVALSSLQDVKGFQNLVAKPLYYACDWILTFIPDLSTAKQLSVLGKQAKNVASTAGLPDKTITVGRAAANLFEKRDASALGNFANKLGLLTMPLVDVIKVFADAVSPLKNLTLKVATTAYNSASVFTSVYGTAEELMNIGTAKADNEKDKEATKAKSLADRAIDARNAKITESWMKIGMYINYFALGALGLGITFADLVVAPWVILALATGGLVFTLLSHFHKELNVLPAEAKMSVAAAAAAKA